MLYSTADNYIIQFAAALGGILANPNNIQMKTTDAVEQADVAAVQACSKIESRIGAQFTTPPLTGLFDAASGASLGTSVNVQNQAVKGSVSQTGVIRPDGSPISQQKSPEGL
jgi:hypothetical protein